MGKKHKNQFPGFPEEKSKNFWQYPKILDGFWCELSGSEQKVLDFILRRTWGFNKEWDYIGLSQFQHGVGVTKKWVDVTRTPKF